MCEECDRSDCITVDDELESIPYLDGCEPVSATTSLSEKI